MSLDLSKVDLTELTKQSLQLVNDYLRNYASDKSTTRLLITGTVTLSTIYVIKDWLNMLRIRHKSKIKGPIPLPLIGNWGSVMVSGLCQGTVDLVKTHGKTFLFFEGSNPSVYSADPEFIKTVTIKDFKYFMNRRTFGFENVKLWKDSLLIIQDETWKNIRSIVTTVFTSGKLKRMIGNICSSSDRLVKHLEELMVQEKPYDAQKAYTSFGTDVICANFFGVEIDTINEPDHPLLKNVAKIFELDYTKNWKLIFLLFFPRLGNYLLSKNMLDVVDAHAMQYVKQLFEQIIEERKSKKERRDDFIQMMVELEEDGEIDQNKESTSDSSHHKRTLTNEQILAQALIFMVIGADSTATALTYTSYFLALNQQYQDKLIEEIDTVLAKHNDEITYEAINEMEYMQSCISEAQRLFPVTLTDRIASCDYEYKGIVIKKDTVVNLMLNALQHDEQVYPDAFTYNPDRERPAENFTPFGSGPRNCIAQRFALIEMKILLTKILSKYRFDKCAETTEKIAPDDSVIAKPTKPVFLKTRRR